MSEKKIHKVGIIMNGVTGRMGPNQHLRRSIWAIIRQGGVKLGTSEAILPEPVLVGRNPAKLEAHQRRMRRTALDHQTSTRPWPIPGTPIYFDAQTTDRRAADVKKAIAAGKHIYCEKPVADNLGLALELLHLAGKAGVKHGVVQDKLWLPGLRS